MDVIKAIETEQMKENLDVYRVGDTVKVYFKIKEGDKERIQIYEGLVIAFNNGGIRKTVTIRKNSYGVGVERIFPVHSPRVERVEVVRRGRVRRAKLYYIRGKIGKAAKVQELIIKKR
ncbi:MAG: 50S ribosomal protein L19 [Spirochaetia bacterium]|nr:50S ribosomal protein L19 [Spirochaetia bacterium]